VLLDQKFFDRLGVLQFGMGSKHKRSKEEGGYKSIGIEYVFSCWPICERAAN